MGYSISIFHKRNVYMYRTIAGGIIYFFLQFVNYIALHCSAEVVISFIHDHISSLYDRNKGN